MYMYRPSRIGFSASFPQMAVRLATLFEDNGAQSMAHYASSSSDESNDLSP
jgi:hypothetical protein